MTDGSTDVSTNAGGALDGAANGEALVGKLEDKMSIDEAVLSAPPPKKPYTQAGALEDLPCVQYALETFLQSKMVECEDYMNGGDPKKCVRRAVLFWSRPLRPFIIGQSVCSKVRGS
jgi:hypothetical protein